jgi:hypothetical protein
MLVTKNFVQGTTAILSASDALDDVPGVLKDLVTDELRRVFLDPAAHLRSISGERCIHGVFGRLIGWSVCHFTMGGRDGQKEHWGSGVALAGDPEAAGR